MQSDWYASKKRKSGHTEIAGCSHKGETTEEKEAIGKPGREASEETKPTDTLTLDF